MQPKFHPSTLRRRLTPPLAVLVALALLLTSVLVAQRQQADASSHREAPLISQDAYADNTDTYVFVSPNNPDNIVLIGSWIPFEGPEGGPNYWEWGNGVLYDIHVDNDGDAVADFTYTLSSTTSIQNPLTFLYNVGPIGADGTNWNRQQRITVTESSSLGTKTLLDNVLAPPVNIGSKSTDDYANLSNNFIYTAHDGGDQIMIYAGQVDDAFWVDLQVFDLVTLRGQQPPLGYAKGNNSPVDSVAGFNNHSLVIEVPISRLTAGGEPVLGVWATARRPAMRVLNGPAGLGTLDNSGDPVQVSRLGMPLTNEVVLPYALKDAFNSISPDVDLALYTGAAGSQIQEILQRSVEDPEVGRLLCTLYGVPLPGDSDKDCSTEVTVGTPRSGRGDIFDIFLTGMVLANEFTINTASGPVTLPAGFNVNQPAGVRPADMIRVNTNIKGGLCSPTPSRLGVVGGDACGFPNGRRLFDDIVEIELLAVAGAAYHALDGRDTSFSFNPALVGILDDGVDYNDVAFRSDFPYMGLAQSGQEHIHQNPAPPPVHVNTVAFVGGRTDDAEESENGHVKLFSKNLELGERKDDARTVGLRFTDVQIPRDAEIVSAYIQFVAAKTGSGPASLTFQGEATDDASTFEKWRFNLSSRTPTDTQVEWTDVPAWETPGEAEWSPDLSSIVQEIVGRDGWSQGNSLAMLITGTGTRVARAYDGDPDAAPCLIVEYIMPDGSTGSASAALAGDTMGRPTNVVGATVLVGERTMTADPNEVDDEDLEDDIDDSHTRIFLPNVVLGN
ncbi:MAG: DUF4331 domain-containing protein [Caldilineaceae bacterium]|nr:DUF4331 domain-containing protein [Caldilineaceae bacterium]